MPSNKLRARLVGWWRWEDYNRYAWWTPADESVKRSEPPSYDTSRDACAELINYLWHHQGHNAVPRFFHEFTKAIGCARDDAFAMLRATPAQICAAFDATFAEELAELESKHGK